MTLQIQIGSLTSQPPLTEETKQYLESHPKVAEQLQRAEKVYQIFGRYVSLTQSRIIVRESGASNAEAELGATVSRTDFQTAERP
jgi:hypothetical protein